MENPATNLLGRVSIAHVVEFQRTILPNAKNVFFPPPVDIAKFILFLATFLYCAHHNSIWCDKVVVIANYTVPKLNQIVSIYS